MPLREHMRQCAGKTRSGETCRNPAVRGSELCRQHGGKAVNLAGRFEKGNTAAWRHGAYSARLGGPKEERLLQSLLDSLTQDFGFSTPIEQAMARAAAYEFVKWLAAAKADDADRLTLHDRRLSARLKFLRQQKARRDLAELNRRLTFKWAKDFLAGCRA